MVARARRFKDGIYEQLARLGKALSAPKRLELLDLLCQGPRTVEVLAQLSALSVANASQHLRVLRAARLVEAERKGCFVEYRLGGEDVSRLYHSLGELAHARLSELEQITRDFFDRRDVLEPVEREELLCRVRAGEVTVVDVRPREEYETAHLPGAISIPLGELDSRLKEIPKGRTVVAYCRGPYCVMSAEAVGVLRKRGYQALRLDEGVVDFRVRGWRVEATKKLRARPWRAPTEKENWR